MQKNMNVVNIVDVMKYLIMDIFILLKDALHKHQKMIMIGKKLEKEDLK